MRDRNEYYGVDWSDKSPPLSFFAKIMVALGTLAFVVFLLSFFYNRLYEVATAPTMFANQDTCLCVHGKNADGSPAACSSMRGHYAVSWVPREAAPTETVRAEPCWLDG